MRAARGLVCQSKYIFQSARFRGLFEERVNEKAPTDLLRPLSKIFPREVPGEDEENPAISFRSNY